MADEEKPEWQNHVKFLDLCEVWKIIGLTLPIITGEGELNWSEDYRVNIAVVDSGVKKEHRAFTTTNTTTKVVSSKCLPLQGEDNSISTITDCDGHGTFCAGVAAGFNIYSPNPVQVSSILNALPRLSELLTSNVTCSLEQNQEQNQELAEIIKELAGSPSKSLPYFVGVAPFAHIHSLKVYHDHNKTNIEKPVALALKEILSHNTLHQDKKEKVHIVCISLALHYNDELRQAMYEVLNNDVIVVTAACNKGQTSDYCNGNIWFPARFGNTISVGSHDILGRPSRFTSVGREVDFLAPGEEIWGPSIKGTDDAIIEKGEGTSYSAAIVSGIVALVLAFVHKDKGPDARAKISNNPVMKEILGKMATKRGQHDKVEGYGNLKPLRVFGHGAYILRNFVENLPSTTPFDAGDTKVSKFILSEASLPMTSLPMTPLPMTSLPMISPQEQNSAPNPSELFEAESFDRYSKYPYNYDERNEDNSKQPCRNDKIQPWRYGRLTKSTVHALDYLTQRRLTNHVEVIDLSLTLPLLYPPPDGVIRDYRKFPFARVLEIILDSQVERIDHFVFPELRHLYCKDLCEFMNNLPHSVLSHIKSIVMPFQTPLGVLCRIAHILQEKNATTSIYAKRINPETVANAKLQTCKFPPIDRVKVITDFYPEKDQQVNEKYGFKIPFNIEKNRDNDFGTSSNRQPATSDAMLCVDEIKSSAHLDGTSIFSLAAPNVFYPVSLKDQKVTVAILGDAINIHHSEISGKINLDSNLKSFTVPSGGTVESVRYLGTFCASIIAGNTKGIAPFVDLVYATVINAEAKTKPEWVISALEWIERKDPRVDIVVIPLGFTEFNLGLFKIINKLSKKMVVVCSAGISRATIRPAEICYPAKYGDVICVGSHDYSCRPSSFSPHGREIDILARECVTFDRFSVDTPPTPERHGEYAAVTPSPRIIHDKYSLSGTCIAAAYAAGVIAQIVAFALECGFERQQITNNTVMRELLKHLTCNFSHDPHSGYGWIEDLSQSYLFKSPAYFKSLVKGILGNGR